MYCCTAVTAVPLVIRQYKPSNLDIDKHIEDETIFPEGNYLAGMLVLHQWQQLWNVTNCSTACRRTEPSNAAEIATNLYQSSTDCLLYVRMAPFSAVHNS